jgi:hypothetical protein
VKLSSITSGVVIVRATQAGREITGRVVVR